MNGKAQGAFLEAAQAVRRAGGILAQPLSLQHCWSGFPEALPAFPISPCTDKVPAPRCPSSRLLCCSRREIYLENIFSKNSKEETGQLQQIYGSKDNLLRSLWWRRCQCIGAHPAATVQALGARRSHQLIKQHPMSVLC